MSDIVRLFGDFAIDPARGCLLRAGQPLHLRPQAYKALKYLADNRGRLLTKDQIIEEVWEGRAVTDDSLVQCLHDVRQALGEDSHYLRNERGRGYILEQEPEAIRTDAPAVARRWSRRHLAVRVVAALGAAAVALVYISGFAGHDAAIRSVAVLPFDNGTGDSGLDYLSDGLSERLIDRLSQLPGVTVIARSSSFTFRGSDTDVMKVAKALGVRAVVTGRIRRRGDQLEIRAELVDTKARTQVWGEQYAGRTVDVHEVQEEIVRAIAHKLRLPLNDPERQQLARRPPPHPRAYELYLNGLFYGAKGGFENTATALDHYTQSVGLDQDFAPAWAQMARAHLSMATMSWRDPAVELARATDAAQKAVVLDATLADAHVAMASIRQHK